MNMKSKKKHKKYKKSKIRKQDGGGFLSDFSINVESRLHAIKNNGTLFFGSLKNKAMGNFNSVKSKLCNMGGSKKTQKNRKKYKKYK